MFDVPVEYLFLFRDYTAQLKTFKLFLFIMNHTLCHRNNQIDRSFSFSAKLKKVEPSTILKVQFCMGTTKSMCEVSCLPNEMVKLKAFPEENLHKMMCSSNAEMGLLRNKVMIRTSHDP